MALAALSKALGLNCLFQKAELESKLATPVRKSNESRTTQPEDQKKPGGDRNYAAAAKNKNQQAAALEATNRWDVAPAMSLCCDSASFVQLLSHPACISRQCPPGTPVPSLPFLVPGPHSLCDPKELSRMKSQSCPSPPYPHCP